MSDGEVNKIVSNDYADLIVEYNNDYNIIKQYGNDFTTINIKYALVNVPVQEITQSVLSKYRFSDLPTCYGLLDTASLEASGVTRVQAIPNLALRGQGVLIGIVDTGIEYTNTIFQLEDKTTKLYSLWDQNIETANHPEKIPYGTEYTREQINEAIRSENPLSIVPSTDEVGHGTMLAGVAAGSSVTSEQFSGVAPDAELVVVKLKPAKPFIRDLFLIPQEAVCYEENDIMFGVQYLVNVALKLNRPIAICIGLGSSSGAHDGRDALSNLISSISDMQGTIVVVAGGNEGNSGHHYSGAIDNKIGYDTVELKVGKDVSGFTAELWGAAPNIYSIDILSPSGEYIPRISARVGAGQIIRFLFESTVLFIDYDLIEYSSGNQLILMRFQNPAEGNWRFRVYGTGNLVMNYNVWLPIENFLSADTFFLKPDPETTVTSPGYSNLSTTVTAYDPVTKNLYLKASRGFSIINDVKPEFAAPGVDMIVPGKNNSFVKSSGTSIAAAHTSGVAAMLLEWGIVKGNAPNMDGITIKNILIRGAKRDPNTSYPNKEWGFGILDLYNTFLTFRNE